MLEYFSRILIRSLVRIFVLRLAYLMRKSDVVKRHLVNQNRLLCIATQDQSMRIPILFNEAGVKVIKILPEMSPLFVEFMSARVALSLIFKANGNLFMKAMQQKELSIKGDLSSLAWYARLGKYLLPANR